MCVIAKFLKTPISKNICELLFLSTGKKLFYSLDILLEEEIWSFFHNYLHAHVFLGFIYT